jgi:hypothetical protein
VLRGITFFGGTGGTELRHQEYRLFPDVGDYRANNESRNAVNTKLTFTAFLQSSAARLRWGTGGSLPKGMYDRLLHSYDITSRTILIRWAKERYPDFFKRYPWAKDNINALWAHYLEWSEKTK